MVDVISRAEEKSIGGTSQVSEKATRQLGNWKVRMKKFGNGQGRDGYGMCNSCRGDQNSL